MVRSDSRISAEECLIPLQLFWINDNWKYFEMSLTHIMPTESVFLQQMIAFLFKYSTSKYTYRAHKYQFKCNKIQTHQTYVWLHHNAWNVKLFECTEKKNVWHIAPRQLPLTFNEYSSTIGWNSIAFMFLQWVDWKKCE